MYSTLREYQVLYRMHCMCISGTNYPTYHVSSFELCAFFVSFNHTSDWLQFFPYIFLIVKRFAPLDFFPSNSVGVQRCTSTAINFTSHFVFVHLSHTLCFVFAGGDCNASIRRRTIDGNIRSNVCAQQFETWTTGQAVRCK